MSQSPDSPKPIFPLTCRAQRRSGEDGRAKDARINSSGAAQIDFVDFITENARLDISGAAEVSLTMGGGDLTGSITEPPRSPTAERSAPRT
jgi:hypothetical protein